MNRKLWAAILLCAVSSLALSQMYQWVDEKGVTHFDDTPPPTSRKAKALDIPTSPPSDAKTGAPAASSFEEKERQFRVRRLQRLETEEKQEIAARLTATAKAQRCAAAKHNLQILNTPGPVFVIDDNAQAVSVPTDARNELIKISNKAIELFCSP